jgi:hypothetical protein
MILDFQQVDLDTAFLDEGFSKTQAVVLDFLT